MEEGELNGELDESSLSLLEINLRKKIMILTGDPKLEKKMENELRFLKRNINCLKKRKPAKEPKKPRKERPIKTNYKASKPFSGINPCNNCC